MSSFGDLNRVNTNIQSLDAQLSLNKINKSMAENQLRMSTGLRINRAEDDAAGFSIATKLNSRVAGLGQALQNVGDAKSVLDIAESSFDTVMDNLVEMKALSTQAANDTLGDTERGYISEQIAQLGNEINEVSNQTVFQGTELLAGNNGTHEGDLTLTFQVGERAEDTIDANLSAVNVNQLFTGSTAAYDAGTATIDASAGITATDNITGVTITVDGVASSTTFAGVTDSSAASLQTVVDEINGLGVEGVTAELDGTDIIVSNADTVDDAVVTFQSGGTALGGATGYTAAAGTAKETGQGSMDLSNWGASEFRNFMADVDSAIEAMTDRVNSVGIAQSSLSTREVTVSQAISANSSAASRIMDADFAKEQSESIRLQILQQTATSALSQANMGPQSVLGFLG
ncbi:flagellin [Gracilimonas sp. Q87]|uniref:flagellin N-terminal helical domain-containing protein n=1 Tax=Gracilimonas sp. Q87 TaxID=3384766 RepID=UPI0039841CA6